MTESVSHRDRSRRAELQRLLGDRGTVHERLARGTLQKPAKGWWATIDEQDVHLGDHSALAAAAIGRYLEQHPATA